MIVLNNLKAINFGRINAKAEGDKQNKTTSKANPKGEETKQHQTFKEMVEPKRIDITNDSYVMVSASTVDDEQEVYVDVRLYKKTDKYEGPTKKGIRLHIEFLEELISSLSLLNEELEEQGL